MKDFYEGKNNWNFDKYEIITEKYTNWDLYEILKSVTNSKSKVLDLGTGGGEKLLKYFPVCSEILGTDLSADMIETANKNLIESKRLDVHFKVMDNLNMDVEDNYFDVVVARHTVTDPKQIYKCLKSGGYLLVRGVDKYDCWSLKYLLGTGQGYHDLKPISIVDYEAILDAGFKDVELVPLHEIEYFKDSITFKEFLKMVPIVYDFSEETCMCDCNANEELIDKYIEENTYNGKVKLIRRYYGILAHK